MNKDSIYIQPNIKFYSSFDEALSERAEYGGYIFREDYKWELKDLFNVPKAFVVAEPGYGKTRLLKKIVLEANVNNKKAIFLDLKKVDTASIEKYVGHQAQSLTALKSDGFKLCNAESVVVCLDALDEVKQEDFSRIVEEIKAFIEKFDKISIIISCRWHYFQKHKELFRDLDFRYVHISPFSEEQVRLYLKQSSIQDRDIERIFTILSFRGRDLIIQTPRYTELIVSYIKDRGIENFKTLTKTQLLEFFIYKKLEVGDKKLNTQKKDLIKRVLEKLALIMEIYQTNLLKKDELMTFFDDLQSDLKQNFLQQVPLEVFYDKSLLKDNIDTIEFDNTEFQEYLAAKEITRLGKPTQVIFELSVDPELREIYPSWFNTLGFAVDLDISLLKPLLDFGHQRRDRIVQDEEYHRFLTKVDVERLPVKERKAIFEQVFSYYQSVLHWIDWDIAKNLSYYFDKSQHDLIKYYIDGRRCKNNETKRFVYLGNVAQVVGSLLERNIFDNEEKAYWKQKLIKFAKDKNENGVLQRNALFALGNLQDDTVIREVESVWKNKDQLIRDSFLELCRKLNPNHNLSIKYFVEGTKREQHFISSRHCLYEVTEVEAVKKLLDNFIHDPSFLDNFIDQESIFKDEDGQFIENIKAVWDSDVDSKLQALIQKVVTSEYWYPLEGSEFIKNIALSLKRKNKTYLLDLILQIAQSDSLKKNLFNFQSLFTVLLEKDRVKEFIKQLSQFENGKQVALWTLQQIKFSKRENAEEIYEEARKYFNNEYKTAESNWENREKGMSEEDRLYKEFQFKLEPEKGKYYKDVFRFYLTHKDKLEPLLTQNDKDRIKGLIESIFDKFDPGKQDLEITEREGKSRSYITSSFIPIFGDCIKVARDLSLYVTRYRKHIINYIPFAYSEHLEAIFSLVKDIQPDEIKGLLSVYKERSSDLWRFMPDSFIRATERYMIKEAVPILREFVAQSDFSIYDRVRALKTSEFLTPDADFLKKVFEQYKRDKTGLKQLAEKANELLIEKHEDKEAITWRFDELIKRAFPFKKVKGTDVVSPQEREFHDKDFAAPLMKLKHPQYQNQFLDVLDKSFNILKRDGYWDYVQYLWQVVSAYFENLKEGKSYRPLRNLESFVQEHSSDEGVNWFKYRLKELKRSYMNFLGKPASVVGCIQKYNQLKSRQYIEIATPNDLYEKLKEVINTDLRRWVESEGAYTFIVGNKIKKTGKQDYEDLIQKTIKTQIENALLKKGFKEVDIIREPQLLDGKRLDFLISYGFIGPILIEVKLSTNPDLGPKKKLQKQPSYQNFIRYMNGYNAHFGIFLVFDTKERTGKVEKWKTHLRKIVDAYQKIDNVEVIDLKCVQI